jgi:hypothetical protein
MLDNLKSQHVGSSRDNLTERHTAIRLVAYQYTFNGDFGAQLTKPEQHFHDEIFTPELRCTPSNAVRPLSKILSKQILRKL